MYVCMCVEQSCSYQFGISPSPVPAATVVAFGARVVVTGVSQNCSAQGQYFCVGMCGDRRELGQRGVCLVRGEGRDVGR